MKRKVIKFIERLGLNPTTIMFNIEAAKKDLFKVIDSNSDKNKIMVNIGGSNFYKRHWRLMDYKHPETAHYNFPGLDYNFDLTSGDKFPFSDNSVYLFYSSHTLEHITDEHCQHIFDEIYRCLRPHGAVRITTPDFDVLYNALVSKNWDVIMNIGGSREYDRYRACVALYGKEQAENMLRNWQKEPDPKIEDYSKQDIADSFLHDFASHRVGQYSLQALMDLVSTLPKHEFADTLISGVDSQWKSSHPEQHNNWWNMEKFEDRLKKSGFSKIYRTPPLKSKFEEMVGVSKYWSFDHLRLDTAIYVEAVKE